VAGRLVAAGYRVELDLRNKSSGEKYYHWELRGVPLRLEIGPKDVEKRSVFAARRDQGKEGKRAIPLDNLETGVAALFGEIQAALLARQKTFVASRLKRPRDLDAARALEAEGVGYVYTMPICSDACAGAVEKGLDIKTLGVPVDEVCSGGACGVCGKPAPVDLRFARTY
ncbi:MAG: His/Gly/Thr/Pro-type tRNA ligase C-terminal domain-containing protein, partial [Thermoplasmatota archaeon]